MHPCPFAPTNKVEPVTVCTIYNAAASTAITAPITPTNEPETTFPALVPEATFNGAVLVEEDPDPDSVLLGFGDPTVTELLPAADPELPPETGVLVVPAAVVVTLAEPCPLPAPVGERPLPDETTADAEADAEPEADEPEDEPLALADALLEVDEEEVTLEQERS